MEEQAAADAAETGGSSAQPGYGVGPWPGGEAEWPAGEQYDPELLTVGDTRNVIAVSYTHLTLPTILLV